jgi:deoxyxylulose-5-phosphate synthase
LLHAKKDTFWRLLPLHGGEEQLPQLAKELRDFIIDIVSARRTSWC